MRVKVKSEGIEDVFFIQRMFCVKVIDFESGKVDCRISLRCLKYAMYEKI